MRAHAKLRVELENGPGAAMRVRMPVLRSEGALVLRPTREGLPAWAAPWDIDPATLATVRLAAGAAGPLGGDHWRLDIEVAEGVSLMLSAVAALLALPGIQGTESWSEVNISVGEDATLIWQPAAQIAAANCLHAAFTRIDLAPSSRLYAHEEVVMGRHGEQPGNMRQRLRVTRGGVGLYDQELAVGPGHPGWDSAAVTGGRRALGSIVLVDTVPENIDNFSSAVSPEVPDTATMRLADDVILISSLAADTIELRGRLGAAFAPFGAPLPGADHTPVSSVTMPL